MPKKYPPLTQGEVISILKAFNFKLERSRGSHNQYSGKTAGQKRIVTVDMAVPEFDAFLIKSMISQSGVSYEEFYCATKATAKKINKRFNR